MNDVLQFVERPYNLRSNFMCEVKGDYTVYNGSENLSSLAPKLLVHLPNSIKDSASLMNLNQN